MSAARTAHSRHLGQHERTITPKSKRKRKKHMVMIRQELGAAVYKQLLRLVRLLMCYANDTSIV
jgi:hypothetical protein